MQPEASLLVLGATGAVGSRVLELALGDPRVGRVAAPTRRPLPAHAKLLNPVVDFARLPDAAWWKSDACVCCLGTTQRLAGSKQAFEQIDRGYVIDAARRARAAGTPCFVYNSSTGADEHARSFYLRIKGLVEEDLNALGFASVTHVRPSLLANRPDPRPLERVMLALIRPLAFLLPRNLRPVDVTDVARALIAAARNARPGVHVIESGDIQ